MSVGTIAPAEAARLLAAGEAVLVDVREADERARLRASGSAHLPLSRLGRETVAAAPGSLVLFHCESGRRTGEAGARLAAAAPGCEVRVVEGGLDAWRRAGLPVEADARAPLPLMRQVQIAAGLLVLLGAALGALVSPWLHLLSAGVGAGLVMAGVLGLCPMARLLARMPWNRQASSGG